MIRESEDVVFEIDGLKFKDMSQLNRLLPVLSNQVSDSDVKIDI